MIAQTMQEKFHHIEGKRNANKVSYRYLYDIVSDNLNTEYNKVKKNKRGKRISFNQFRKIINNYLNLVIMDAIDSYNGKDFLLNMGRLQVFGIPHTKTLVSRKTKKPISTLNQGLYFYTLMWTGMGKAYKLNIDKYYKKRITYLVQQKDNDYLTYGYLSE